MIERCLVVLATHNEAAGLAPLVEEVLLVGDLLGEPQINVLIIDDHSPDGTGAVAHDLKQAHPGRVGVLHRLERLGLSSAFVVGVRYALASGYDYVVQMGADFAHDPNLLPRFLRAARDADVVVGSRFLTKENTRHWPVLRSLLARTGSYFGRLLLDLPLTDITSRFRCFRQGALAALDLSAIHSDGYSFQIEVAYHSARRGLRMVEVPITFGARRRGQSKLSPGILWEALFMVWQLRFGRFALAARPAAGGAGQAGAETPLPIASGRGERQDDAA